MEETEKVTQPLYTCPRTGVANVVKLTLQFKRPISLYIIAFLLSLGPNLY